MLPKDYIRYRFTGNWVTDWTDAGGTLLMDYNKKKWSDEICNTIKLSLNRLPEILPPLEISGKINSKVSDLTSMPAGTPVITGACDPAAELFGTALFGNDEMAIKLATAGVIFYTTEKPIAHPKILTYPHVIPDKWFSLTGTNSCASSVRWFRDLFCETESIIAKKTARNVYELMDEEADKSEIGSGGLIYHPYLAGERSPYWDPKLKGSFTGMGIDNKKYDFIRSIFEGVSFSLRDCLDLLYGIIDKDKFLGKSKGEVLLLGGGSKSKVWSRILSEVLGITLVKLRSVDASFGSALIGAIGISMFKDYEQAGKICVKTSGKIIPDKKNSYFYSDRFKIYKQIHDSLAVIYDKL
jgi:xylulokinase